MIQLFIDNTGWGNNYEAILERIDTQCYEEDFTEALLDDFISSYESGEQFQGYILQSEQAHKNLQLL